MMPCAYTEFVRMTKEEIQALITEMTGGFVTKDDFGKTTAFIRKQGESVEGLTAMLGAIVEKGEDGNFKVKIATPVAPPVKKDDKTPEWQSQLEGERKSRESWQAKFEAEKTAREGEQARSAIIDALNKVGAVNASRDYVHVQGMVKRGEDGSFHVVRKDEFGAENKIGLDTAFGDFLKGNPELAKPSGKPGSGTPAGSPNGGSGQPAKMTAEYFSQNKAKILSGEIPIE